MACCRFMSTLGRWGLLLALALMVPFVAAEEAPAEDAVVAEDSGSKQGAGAAGEDEVDVDRIAEEVAKKLAKNSPVKVSYGSKGFRLESQDGRFQTNLQWRAQLRFTNPTSGDPRQVSAFQSQEESTFEARRVRMKIGGHGFKPWIKYYFEVDLQPSRDVDDSSASSSARVIDWRIDVAKFRTATIRVGQWKIDLNRERVDSSGKQQFVERSIANRVFTIDRQVGVQLKGHLFKDTPGDLRYWAGVFTGEGRGVRNNDENLLTMGRVQWNFLGRDLAWKQTDVERTEKAAGSFAIGAAKNRGSCTRWSSSGCGNLDGFESPGSAEVGQFDIDQVVQELAYKSNGFSFQQEYHRKRIEDRVQGTRSELTGGYAQAGYFFHEAFEGFPEPLELAIRYAKVEEPNVLDRSQENKREEFTFGTNWFFAGHRNKLTLDYSHLTLDDSVLGQDVSDDRVRFQWDVSF